jgi:hypothetical protein
VPPRPPRRPTRVDTIGGTSVKDPTTERALSEVRELISRMQTRQATSSGSLTIAADLEFNDFSALEVHTMQMTNLGSSPGESSRIYMIGDDWYVSDGNGNEIQITSGGAIAVTGTADLYGDRSIYLSLRECSAITGSLGGGNNGYSIIETASNNTTVLFGPLQVRRGERLKGARIRTNKNSLGTMTLQYATSNDGSGLSTTGTSATSSTNGLQTLSVTLASPVTTAQDVMYYLQVTCPNSGDRIHAVEITVDKVV